MAHRRYYFKADIRDPYMGNTLPMKFEIRVYEENVARLVIKDSEGREITAQSISIKTFNE